MKKNDQYLLPLEYKSEEKVINPESMATTASSKAQILRPNFFRKKGTERTKEYEMQSHAEICMAAYKIFS